MDNIDWNWDFIHGILAGWWIVFVVLVFRWILRGERSDARAAAKSFYYTKVRPETGVVMHKCTICKSPYSKETPCDCP
jgi:hypothetical protein